MNLVRRIATVFVLSSFLLVSFLASMGTIVSAADKKDSGDKVQLSQSPSISQAYYASDDVQLGMIVMIDSKDSKKVVPLTEKKDTSMHGVIVPASATILSVGNEATATQVFVSNQGKYEVLVSTQNGTIKPGDLITISALDGIGMKADTSQSVILGRALTPFDGENRVNGKMLLKGAVSKREVAIGKIGVDIGIAHNPIAVSVTGPPVPSFLKKAGEYISGKPVSTIRLYICLLILVITMFVTGSLLYGGVKSSLVAVGRNPLAKKAIVRGLIQVIIIGLIIFVLGLFSIYLILKL